jgi:HSP20 family protein
MGFDRWDPFREMVGLRDTMDRLLQQNLRPGQLLSTIRPDAIPLDVVEREDSYIVRAALPGVNPDDIEVVVQGERLTLRAEVKEEQEQRGDNGLVRELRTGSLQRTISLPSPVSSDKAEAKVENGVLTLRLPKIQETLPRRISVSTSGQQQGQPEQPKSTEQARPAPATEAAPPPPPPSHGDRVTQESQESFPASDPPSWTPEKV